MRPEDPHLMTIGRHSVRLRALLGALALALLMGCASSASAEWRPMLSERFGIVHRYTGTVGWLEGVKSIPTLAMKVLAVDGRDVASLGVELVLDSMDGEVGKQIRQLAYKRPTAQPVEVVGCECLFGGGIPADPHGRHIANEDEWKSGALDWSVRRHIRAFSLEVR